ncbi:hypothetical protein [Chitinophaga japonensis]|uniref:Uncharacterized protein n=1 Tax=Chitinophaga japonensis TaxID=104662 RepID=A0A562TCZ9_CHIJA|nr:hypothetical protein [Chitinophaga japonensis]TWI91382.1 hypothetical protein LX66_0751 [Chitinophaga japonensis]
MRKTLILLLLTFSILAFGACRTQKTGCPSPRKNWGAEKVLDELNKPGKKKEQA